MDRAESLPALAPGLRKRAYAYAFGLFAEVILIVGCFCWMSEVAPCKVPETDDAEEGTQPPRKPCDEATYLFCIFYLGLAKDLAFFLAGLKTEDLGNEPDRVRSIFMQYVASLGFFGLTSGVASVLYVLQPTEHLARRVLYVAGGAAPNIAIVLDCIGLGITAWRRGYRAIFPDVEEIKPFKYEELTDKSSANTWYLKECSICLDNFENDDSVVRLPCGHLFHTDCVVGWLRRTMTCPVRCQLGHFVVALPPGEAIATGKQDVVPQPPAHDPEAQEPRGPDGHAPALPGRGGHANEVPPVMLGGPLDDAGSDHGNQVPPMILGIPDDEGSEHGNEVPPVMLGVPEDVPYID